MCDDAAVRPAGARTRRAGDDAPTLQRAAAAFADGHAIHWTHLAALARTPHDRALTQQLGLIAALAGDATATVQARRGAGVGRRWLVVAAGAALLLAVLCVAALLTIPGADIWRDLVIVVSWAGAAAWLGRRPGSPHAAAFSIVLWLAAVQFARPLAERLAVGHPFVGAALAWALMPLVAVLPAALWQLACHTPELPRFTPTERACRRLVPLAVLCSAGLAIAQAWAASVAESTPRVVTTGAGAGVVGVWASLALGAIIVRTSQADADERRRVRRWCAVVAGVALAVAGAGVLGGVFSEAVIVALGVAPWAAAWPARGGTASATTWTLTGAVARRVASATLVLGVAASAWWLARSGVIGQPTLTQLRVHAAPVLAMTLLVALMAWGWRARSWRTSEAALAAMATELRQARTPREVATRLVAHVGPAIGGGTVALLVPGAAGWEALAVTTSGTRAAHVSTLSHESALASMLSMPGEAPMGFDGARGLRRLLPDGDRAWLDACGAEWLVPLSALDGPPRAALLVGGARRATGGARRVLAFVAAAAATAAMALERCAAVPADVHSHDEFAHECTTCGLIAASAGPCACGGTRVLAALPPCLDGKFRVERRLGCGGMGVVYLATDLTLHRPVALKTLPRLGAAEAAHLQAEARAMAAAAHPSMAVLYGFELWRGTPVLVVEYFGAGTLARRLTAGALPVATALTCGIALAEALADLHRRGWIHRDVKPSNIAFADDGRPVLLDFGLTRLIARPAEMAPVAPTRSEVEDTPPLAGTPLYLSPEALDGADVGPHDDVWALAVVLFEAITGRHPYTDVPAEMPSAVASVLAAALHRDPAHRLTSAADFARALRTAAAA